LTFALLVFLSCYDRDLEGPEPVDAFSVSTSVPTLSLRPDDVASFTVAVRNVTRNQSIAAIGAWAESDAPLIARVEATSRPDSFKVTAVDAGTARIIVGFTTTDARDTIIVTNSARPVATLTLTPDSTTVILETTGTATPLRAVLRDAAGDTIRQRTATFSVPLSDTSLISVVASTGVVTGKKLGTARVVASREGKEDTSKVVVIIRPVTSVTVTPGDTTVRVNNTVQLTATVRGTGNVVLTDRPVTWASSDTTVATVNASGLVRGVRSSNQFVSITATSEGRSGTGRVIVIP
jgi:hypothetical protein